MSFAASPLLIRSTISGHAAAKAAYFRRPLTNIGRDVPRAVLSTVAGAAPTQSYSKGVSLVHWLGAAGTLVCFGSVQAAMNSQDKAEKAQLMKIHKSTGLLLGGLLVPRLVLRLASKVPGPVPGSPAWEGITASVSHLFLYAFSIGMPASGIAMGYYGGSGLPFFGFKIPGIPKEQRTDDTKAIAKNSFMMHKRVGQLFEYLVPLHVAGAAMHYFKGQRIFSRISPFSSNRSF